jgi:hypothetical protein
MSITKTDETDLGCSPVVDAIFAMQLDRSIRLYDLPRRDREIPQSLVRRLQ